MKRSPRRSDCLLLTCEHGGNRIPRAYAALFLGADALLESHRGWDRGALALARALARDLDRPLLAVTWSRLLVDANRAPTNRRIWSRFTASLPADERARILARFWRPHRSDVERAAATAARRGRVVHVAVHSFVPELEGKTRNADVGLLYDSRRKSEAELCRRWAGILRRLEPGLRIRFNHPYSGRTDGLTTWMRRLHSERRYLGIELEINQALVGGPHWRRLQRHLAASLGELTAPARRPRRVATSASSPKATGRRGEP